MNKYKASWLILTLTGVGLMVTAVLTTVDIEGQCTSIHTCHLVNDLGMDEYKTYIGFTTGNTIFLAVISLIILLCGMIPAKLEELKNE